MVKRLSIWFTPNHCSVDIVRSATTRQHTASDMPSVIGDLRPDDRALLIDFCTAVLACAEANDCTALETWKATTV
jgi:hypothetical protein